MIQVNLFMMIGVLSYFRTKNSDIIKHIKQVGKIVMIYDIRNSELAIETLINLTNVPKDVWINSFRDVKKTDYVQIVEWLINEYRIKELNCDDIDFIFSHITTSNNACESIKKYGLLDLRESYLLKDSELRKMLDSNGIEIDIENKLLKYKNNTFDINFEIDCPSSDIVERLAWKIGYKFYFDYNICGFLTLENSAYSGNIHKRPEILLNIDQLLDLQLSKKWASETIAYEVVTKVRGDLIDDEGSNNSRWISYLCKAYDISFCGQTENIILLKRGVKIPKENVLEIKKFSKWK